jgi:hypothetical protein
MRDHHGLTTGGRLDHIVRLTDDTAILEHARGLVGNREHGYATDDVARALILVVDWAEPSLLTERLAYTYLSYMADTIRPDGSVRSRMAYDRRWVGPDSLDTLGRALWALGHTAAHARRAWAREGARSCFGDIELPYELMWPRPYIYGGLGASALLRTHPGDARARHVAETCAWHLSTFTSPHWPWPEDRLTYDNARWPEALLALGAVLGDEALTERGLELLGWLIEVERPDRHFSFTPAGGLPHDRERNGPLFDQQPIEAAAMVAACERAFSVTRRSDWREQAVAAAAWFLGLNDLGAAVYDLDTGAGHDGLTADGLNANAGAESTISALQALQAARSILAQQDLEQGRFVDGGRTHHPVGGTVGEVDTAVLHPMGSLDEDDIVDVAESLPAQLGNEDGPGKVPYGSAAGVVEQDHSSHVRAGGIAFVVEEQEPSLGSDRGGPRSDAKRTR